MVLHSLPSQVTEPHRELRLQVTVCQASRLIARQPVHGLHEQFPYPIERVLVCLQRVRSHPGSFLFRFGLDTQDRNEKEPFHISIIRLIVAQDRRSATIPHKSRTQSKWVRRPGVSLFGRQTAC